MPFPLGLRAERESWMAMSLLVSLCALLGVGLLVLPLFGARVAALTAAALILGIFTACYVICIPRAFGPEARGGNGPRA